MILNIGCGGTLEAHKNIYFGDVRADIKPSSNVNIICDAIRLPFKDNTFSLVYASHVLEHLQNPLWCMKEFIRVCYHEIIITIPYLQGYSEAHIYSWDIDSFNHFLNLFPFDHVFVKVTGKRFPAPKRLSSIFRLIEYTLKPPCELKGRCIL